MTRFRRALAERNPDPAGRRWIYVPYDQVSDAIGPLSRENPGEVGVIVVENAWKASRRPYHKQKLALVIANMRQFALEQAERGVAVRHVFGNAPYRSILEPLVRELGPVRVMRPAERELRVDLGTGLLDEIPHEGWLSTPSMFDREASPWLMERFYRDVRRATGILMDGSKPVGGKFNFDAENRKPWKGTPPAPVPPSFGSDAVKEEVLDLVAREYADHPGTLDGDSLPRTLADAELLWAWAKEQCLAYFGEFEDAMSVRSSGLFHTRISPLLNIHRLLPARVVRDVEAMNIPLNAKEGFVRQVLGWREFMRHVHEATDGFRTVDRDASPSALGAAHPLPPLYWGAKSGMNCLDTVVADVWREGWSHHITRLMILSNFATLTDVSPRELTDWFWVAYTDAYDWVVEPNVLGMSTFGTGQLFTTKPYVSGANYIRRMSDYCDGCRFDPKTTCPFTPLYWAFLERHEDVLGDNVRMAMPYRTLRTRRPDQSALIQIRERLAAGDTL